MITQSNLKDIRHALHLTQGAIATMLGVPYRTYQDWEYLKRTMPANHLLFLRAIVPSDIAAKFQPGSA